MTLGLVELVSAIEEGAVAVGSFENTFNAAYCAWWAARKIDEEESLSVRPEKKLGDINDL
jgi:hypothetical protein